MPRGRLGGGVALVYKKPLRFQKQSCISTKFKSFEFIDLLIKHSSSSLRVVTVYRGGHRGLLETEKPRKKSPKTAKPQEISSKTENQITLLTHKALAGFRISLSVINFYTYKLILLSEVLSGYFLVSAEHNVV